jgi:hypothetical protein
MPAISDLRPKERTLRQRYGLDSRERTQARLQRIHICLRPGRRVAVTAESRIDRNDLLIGETGIGSTAHD